MPFRCKCELLGRFGVALKPPWDPKGASVHFKPPFSRILSPKGTQSGTQKSPLGPQGHHLSLQSVSWSDVSLDLRSHLNLAPRITTKVWLFRDVRHGWNITNNISKPLFFVGCWNTCFSVLLHTFLTRYGTQKQHCVYHGPRQEGGEP